MQKNEKRPKFDEIRKLLHDNAELGFSHTDYDEEILRFQYLMKGDMRAVEESDRIMMPSLQGTLSRDPLRNYRYLFIVNTGLASRYLIETGIPQETVYAISDVYIQKADVAGSFEQIRTLNIELWTLLVETVKNFKRERGYSKQVSFCMDYIDRHFNEKITLAVLARELDLNLCYLEVLFKKETGVTFGKYLLDIRMKTAAVLLVKTEYTYSQIAYSLAFCSQSHFTKTFREYTGYTPGQYRQSFYNKHISIPVAGR
ncbi:MAG: AraC family transcriptional regulator [Lachnospiraceae bacterium]|nr:AraC family transcriptional regulator [Lachnospiraceae bacterium]